MVTEVVQNNSFLAYCKGNKYNKTGTRKSVCVWWEVLLAVISCIIAAASLGVGIAALVVSNKTYDTRYDADAKAAGGIEFTFKANGKDSSSSSFTASVGKVTYGYFQKSGKTPTEYCLQYKNSTSSSYSTLKTLTVYYNNDYTGEFTITTISKSTKFDVKCTKKNNKTTQSVFEFDWGIE